MTKPVDITDPRIVKAYAHPLRIQILGLLENRTATPRQLADELAVELPQLSYHVRQLKALGLVKLVSRKMKRGAVEHYYTARVRPTITDAGWSRAPEIVKRAMIGGKIAQAGAEIAAAAESGGFDRSDIHFSRTRMRLSEEGWHAASRELAATLERIDAIAAEDASRSEGNPDVQRREATALLMFFEAAVPDAAMPAAETLDDAPRARTRHSERARRRTRT